MFSERSLFQDLVEFLESLPLPDGGTLKLYDWQLAFLEKWCGGTGDAVLTCSRGSGKSGLASGLAAAVIDPRGPLHQERAEVIVQSASYQQARVLMGDVRSYLDGCLNREKWRTWDSQSGLMIQHRPSESSAYFIGHHADRLHGRRPSLLISDESAALSPRQAEQVFSVGRTSLGKREGAPGRLLAISTRSADSNHPFEIALKTWPIRQIHSSKQFSMAGARIANPSLKYQPSLEARVKEEYNLAKADPSAEASFKSLRLNQGTSVVASEIPLATAQEFQEHVFVAGAAADDGGYVLALDVGGSYSSTGIAAYWPLSGFMDSFAVWPSLPDLHTRARRHGVPFGVFDKALKDGTLMIFGEHSTNVAAALAEALRRWGPKLRAVGFDRWKAADCREALFRGGIPYVPVHERGMGWKDGAQDTGAFRRALLEGRIKARRNTMLELSMNDARLTTDQSGNTKITKSNKRALDDVACACAIAVGIGSRLSAHERGMHTGQQAAMHFGEVQSVPA